MDGDVAEKYQSELSGNVPKGRGGVCTQQGLSLYTYLQPYPNTRSHDQMFANTPNSNP